VCAAGQVLPDELTLNAGDIDKDGKDETAVLKKRSIRSGRYLIGTWTDAEGFKKLDPFPVSTYRGYVEDDPAMRVNANIEPGGMFNANFSEGRGIVATVAGRKSEIPPGKGTALMAAGNRVVPLKATRASPTPGGYLVPPQPMRRIRFAAEIGKGFIDEVGGNLETAVCQVEQRFNDGDFVYARDLGVAWELAVVVIRLDAGAKGVSWKEVRDADPGATFNLLAYFPGSAGRPRSWGGPIFRSEDPASFAPLSVARVGVRAASGLVHEAGHKFTACHNMDDGDAMTGAQSFLGSSNVQLMLRHCEGRSEKVFPAVIYSDALPPFAMDDFANTTKDRPVVIDVLDNDYDGNGDVVLLQSVVPRSQKGGAAVLSDDKKKVVYTPPPGFVGVDRLAYTVADAAGLANRTGRIKVDVRTGGLASYLPLDQLENGKLPALGPYKTEGNVSALKTSFEKGVRGNALFNQSLRTRGYVQFPDTGDPGRSSLSVSLWVLYRDSQSLAQSGVILCKGACRGGAVGTGALRGWGIGHREGGKGFIFAGNSVRSRSEESFYLVSDESIRPNTWYHLAVVFDRTTKKMRAWVDNKEVLGAASRPAIPDDIIECYAPLVLFNGFDWKAGSACAAMVDEVRIYTGVLTPKQVAELYAGGSDAKAPDAKSGAVE
jgi:hypothetical protein